MDPNFSSLSLADFDWVAHRFELGPRLVNLAYKQILNWFEAGLASFTEFHFHCEVYEEEHFYNEVYDENYRDQPFCVSEKTSKCIRNMRSVLDRLPGFLGDTIRYSLLMKLVRGVSSTVEIKPAVLFSIFGHESLTKLSITLMEVSQLFPEQKLFETMASTCANLKELSIDVGFLVVFSNWEIPYYWKALELLTSLESLTIVSGKLPSDLSFGLKLKTLKLLSIKDEDLSSFQICAFLLRLEFKYIAQALASLWLGTGSGRFRPSTIILDELLQCAGNEACLQPICQSLTTLVIEKDITNSFWQPASAAFLLLACPNLTNLQTTDFFPHFKALRLLNKRKEAGPQIFNLTQLFVMLEHSEDFQAMVQATPHCQELIIQGLSNDDWLAPDHKTYRDIWFQQLLDPFGEKASALSVTYKVCDDIYLEEFASLSTVHELRLEAYWARYFMRNDEGNAITTEHEPMLKNIKRLSLDGCLKDSSSEEAFLFAKCPNLEKLYLHCIHFCSRGKELVEFARQHWRNLKFLHIKSLRVITWEFDDLMGILKVCTKLQTLVLPFSVLSKLKREQFAKLDRFAAERGVQIRYSSPEKRELYCTSNQDDEQDSDEDL